MSRPRGFPGIPFLLPAALSALLALVLAACGGGSSTSSGGDGEETASGTPQRGGSAVLFQLSEPRTLDPAALGNSYAYNAILGHALYGALLTVDSDSGEIRYELAEDLSSSDNGTTWTLKLREGLVFSDDSPLTAEAVRYNWERLKDPAVAGPDIRMAMFVDNITVVDDRTLTFTLTRAMAGFPDTISGSALTWIASPAALEAGRQAFDEAPVGAGPFLLKSWTRQDRIELVRNPKFYDPERPYLDAITLRTSSDENMRLNTVSTGGADVMISINPELADKAEKSGLRVTRQRLGGGNALLFNTSIAPFDDPRAREAVTRAVDLDALNAAVYNGHATLATTFFRPESPLFSDIKLTAYDKNRAQALFDELAREGKPVSFKISSYPTGESKKVAEAILTQLSAYSNVSVEIEVLDFATVGTTLTQRQFQSVIYGVVFSDPDFMVTTMLHSTGAGNYMALSDPELDAALDAARSSSDTESRRAAYRQVQERLAELHPFLFYIRTAPAVVSSKEIHGAELIGIGSLLPDRLWRAKA